MNIFSGALDWRNLYIHIPFCASKCGYCAFYSEIGIGSTLRQNYLQAIAEFLQRIEFAGSVQTVYIGGGTPDLLPAVEMAALFEAIQKYVPLAADCEISCELNPECLTAEKMRILNEYVTRLSLGVQSFNSDVRSKLMRRCSCEHLHNALRLLEKRKACHFNIDLIYAVSQVAWSIWENDLHTACTLGVDHLSCYALTAEENSRLGLNAPTADDADAAEWWLRTGEYLAAEGLPRYEVSNYACMGGECRHNVGVWRGETLLGAGAAASGFNGSDRYSFKPDIYGFIRGDDPELDQIAPALRQAEVWAVNLRTTAGWRREQWQQKYSDSWEYWQQRCHEAARSHPEWWMISDEQVALTASGLLFWDEIAGEMLDI